MGAPVIDRQLPTDDAAALLDLTRELATRELAPRAAAAELRGEFPREQFRTLGRAGLLGLPYPEAHGGSSQPYEVYLQVVEELARAWLAVGLGVSVHTLSCHGLANFGTAEQKQRWLPDMLGGELLGAYCLSEPHCGSDAAALRTRAEQRPDGSYLVSGTKAWTTHGGVADFYMVLARTGDTGARGISAFLVHAGTPGMVAAPAERKMGMKSSVTAQVVFDKAPVSADRLIGAPGQGFRIAMEALDAGRLGIAACAVGLAQAALDIAVDYAGERTAFGRPVGEFQGVSFMLADAAAGIEAARQLYLSAARRKDAGRPYSIQAAMAKLVATDTCMQVTTDMVQVLGGAGYVEDYPVERYMREAKVLQIVEGTNQIQRLLIGRSLLDG
ncbi:acyl-CoA dehydrogenase [Longimycelium tulufanense]|uniref:Acyl-CoA dehydrogenase n=1 Tax=Longimycelium tulufanense TaxID=907463 RepID=A0A8J3CBH1_9PSEU|nr:acyl-CoA dehydrogenase family protein [Longimycelium tulufanense]GGM69755.1 acyl-CoA dehydrogenase [Longimycelium tulufanense]